MNRDHYTSSESGCDSGTSHLPERAAWLEEMQLLNETLDYECEQHTETKNMSSLSVCSSGAAVAVSPLEGPVASTSQVPAHQPHETGQGQLNFSRIEKQRKCVTVLKDGSKDTDEMLIINQIIFVPKDEDDQRSNPKRKKTKYTYQFKMSALKIYFTSPFSYRAFQTSFGLPRVSTLYRLCIPQTTTFSDHVLFALKMKVDSMTVAQKQCVVCVGRTNLTPNVYYDFEADKLGGLHEVDGVQRLKPAGTALVVMVRGLFHRWKQAVAFSFISDFQNHGEDVRSFILNIIFKLFKIGLRVRAYMTDLETEKYIGSKETLYDPRKPFIKIGNNKVYYVYDILYLMNNIRDEMKANNFQFGDGFLAQWQHIKIFYNEDEKRNLLKITPNLTLQHILPDKNKLEDIQNVTELFSNATATALSIYMELKVLDASAAHTLQWVVTMNKLMEMLNFSTINPPENKSAMFTGDATQVQFLLSMIKLFQNLCFIPLKGKRKKNYCPEFVYGVIVTIKAILLIYEDLKTENCWYPVVGLSRDCLYAFFQRVYERSFMLQPTTKQMMAFITKWPIFNIFSYFCKKLRSNDLNLFMSQVKHLSDIGKYEDVPSSERANVRREAEEFRAVQVQCTNGLEQLALYVLHKGYQQHSNCPDMKAYVCGADDVYKELIQVTDYGMSVNVDSEYNIPELFYVFILELDMKFKEYFREDRSSWSLAALESFIKHNTFAMPCACFPIDYVKKLFLKFRLYLVLEYNNKAFKSKPKSYKKKLTALVVNDLI